MSKESDRKKRKRREKKQALKPKLPPILYEYKPELIEDDKYDNAISGEVDSG